MTTKKMLADVLGRHRAAAGLRSKERTRPLRTGRGLQQRQLLLILRTCLSWSSWLDVGRKKNGKQQCSTCSTLAYAAQAVL